MLHVHFSNLDVYTQNDCELIDGKGSEFTLASLKCSGRSSSCTVSMSAALAGASGAVSSAECCSDLSLDDWKADEPGLRPSRTPFSRFMISLQTYIPVFERSVHSYKYTGQREESSILQRLIPLKQQRSSTGMEGGSV